MNVEGEGEKRSKNGACRGEKVHGGPRTKRKSGYPGGARVQAKWAHMKGRERKHDVDQSKRCTGVRNGAKGANERGRARGSNVTMVGRRAGFCVRERTRKLEGLSKV